MASFAFFTLFFIISSFTTSHAATSTATWYGAPEGDGSEGGACGYGSAVGTSPFNKLISAGNPSIFKNGYGCGQCYEVKCNSNPACSKKPVTITITDSCLGCEPGHFFDLSGHAFGAMAAPGKADQLRAAGTLNINYKRVPCHYPGEKITFKIDPGSNPYYFSTTPEFENGDGDIGKLEVQNGSGPFVAMQLNEGATWKVNSPHAPLNGPLSIKLTTQSGKSITATKVIPVGWKAGETYRSHVNF